MNSVRNRIAASAAGLLIVTLNAACGGSSGGTQPPIDPGTNIILFSPSEVRLDNPSSPGERSAGETFTLDVTALDSQGQVMTPSAANPITVEIHGAPPGVITPERMTITSGSSASFHYDGSYFPDPIMLTAWADTQVADSALASVAAAGSSSVSLGRTQLLHQNPVTCSYGTETYSLTMGCKDPEDPSSCAEDTIANGITVKAAVGYDDPSSALTIFTVDTGSLGVLVPAHEIGNYKVAGPGASGRKFYNSSGRTYEGKYYLAPVSFALADGSIVTTPPIKVLGVTKAYCANGYDKCKKNPPTKHIHYLGIGFDRNSTAPEDTFNSPADNVFLQVPGSNSGQVSPGYLLTTTAVILGIESTEGFNLVPLAPNATVSGDWTTASGCFALPMPGQPNQFCGHLLLDVGITGMFLDLPTSERPAHTQDDVTNPPTVPDGTTISILAGSPSEPAMSYRFILVAGAPTGPAPSEVKWDNASPIFVNIGRRPLGSFDYLYDARCGNVGFQACPGGSCS